MRTGQIRLTVLNDIAEGARLADGLPHINFVMPFGMAQDIPGGSAEAAEFLAVIENTAKPVFFCGYSAKGAKKVIELASYIAGSREAQARRPFVAPYPEPITLLHFPYEVVGRILACSDYSVSQITAGA